MPNIYDTLDSIEEGKGNLEESLEYVRHYIQGQKDIIHTYSKMITERDNRILYLQKISQTGE